MVKKNFQYFFLNYELGRVGWDTSPCTLLICLCISSSFRVSWFDLVHFINNQKFVFKEIPSRSTSSYSHSKHTLVGCLFWEMAKSRQKRLPFSGGRWTAKASDVRAGENQRIEGRGRTEETNNGRRRNGGHGRKFGKGSGRWRTETVGGLPKRAGKGNQIEKILTENKIEIPFNSKNFSRYS